MVFAYSLDVRVIRLRQIAEQLDGILSTPPGDLLASVAGEQTLLRAIEDAQVVYRRLDSPVHRGQVLPWLMFSFEPDEALLAPFKIYPDRYWVLIRMHRQTSGLPELLTHVSREQPSAEILLEPHLYVSFTQSKSTETLVDRCDDDGVVRLDYYHSASFILPDRSTLPSALCLPGMDDALGEGAVDAYVPGIVEHESHPLYVGSLKFYNSGRTPDRRLLGKFLLNNAAVAVVARLVRDVVLKSLKTQ